MIHADISFTKKHYRALNSFAGNPRLKLGIAIAVMLVFVLLIVKPLIGCIKYGVWGIVLYGGIYFIVGAVTVVKYLYLLITLPKTMLKQVEGISESITFDEEEFVVTQRSLQEDSERRFKYPAIIKASSKNGWFFVATPAGNIVFEQDEITEGLPGQLSELLKSRLGDKFVIK